MAFTPCQSPNNFLVEECQCFVQFKTDETVGGSFEDLTRRRVERYYCSSVVPGEMSGLAGVQLWRACGTRTNASEHPLQFLDQSYVQPAPTFYGLRGNLLYQRNSNQFA